VRAMADRKLNIVLFLLLSPFYAAYGAWVLLTGLYRLVRWASRTARLLKPELTCPACNRVNSLYGRWECRAPGCGAIYLGAADRCQRCGAGASMFFCQECGASISLRSAR
jgi:hypothetical protein